MRTGIIVTWHRHDFRLADNPALYHAFEDAATVVPAVIHAPDEEGTWRPGPSRQWWEADAIRGFQAALTRLGSRLVVRGGDTVDELFDIIASTGADALYFNRRYEPAARHVERSVIERCRREGITCHRFDGSLLHDPRELLTTAGEPYRVFTPFWNRFRAALDLPPPLPDPPITPAHAPARWPASHTLQIFEAAEPDLAQHWKTEWDVSEHAARERLGTFLDLHALDYDERRDVPADDATSRLSPYLATGLISPLLIWNETRAWAQHPDRNRAAESFLRQLAWREFAYHLLYHFPETVDEPMNPRFAAFAWRRDDDSLRRWQEGRTGYPIVDAAMRQMQRTGWMHNRLRMVVASFLTKDLLIPWQEGARWFWSSLVDADLANNTLGWQWAAGCGADAQPFFRIFNPVTQGEKFDRDGRFVRAWLPELDQLPDRFIHRPWSASESVLREAGVRLGETYPLPVVDHQQARRRALDAYAEIR